MERKRILHVLNISFTIPYFLGDQIKWFVDKGYSENIICSPSDELSGFSSQFGFEFKTVEISRKISIINDVKAVWTVIRYIKETKADIVVGHTPKGSLIAMLAAYIVRTPIRIYLRHGLVYETAKGFKRRLLIDIDRFVACLSTKVVCVSPSLANKSIEDRLNPAWKQVVLANGTCNGIDTERFCRERIDATGLIALKNELGISDGDFVLGFSGRMVRDKGVVELVAAFQKFRRRVLNAKLLLVGMLEVRDALPEDVIQIINEDKNIIETGYVLNSVIEKYYALMDVFVLPSYREGFPTSVLEASAMEIPVITTKATGCIDSIIEGETGLFVDHDVDQIEDAMALLYSDVSFRKKMGEQGRNFVVNHFRQELIWSEIEKLYH